MKKFFYILALAQINFVLGTTVTDIDNVIAYKCPITKIEYDPHGAKERCSGGILACYKYLPVKVTYMCEEDEVSVNADIRFCVDQGMTVQSNTIHLNNVTLHLTETKEDDIANLRVNGVIELPYAEIIFADEDRAQQFKEDVDIQCSGKTFNILKKLDSHRCKRLCAFSCLGGVLILTGLSIYYDM